MNYKLAQIHEMAKMYREFRDYSIHRAVHEAAVAYELFRDAEMEVQMKQMENEQCN